MDAHMTVDIEIEWESERDREQERERARERERERERARAREREREREREKERERETKYGREGERLVAKTKWQKDRTDRTMGTDGVRCIAVWAGALQCSVGPKKACTWEVSAP
jgi:hypothetical protein